ncbi:hypothetical protein BH10BAC4_BH10BAC4_02970 [soil metagenome]
MNGLFKGLLAGWGASKIGGGCLSTILVFGLIWWLLGTCDGNQRVHVRPAQKQVAVTVGGERTKCVEQLTLSIARLD